MSDVENSNSHNMRTAEFGKFVKVDSTQLQAEIGGETPIEAYPKYAILTYNIGESPTVSATTGATRGTDAIMHQDVLLTLGLSNTTYSLSSVYIDQNVEAGIFTLISNSGTFARLNFSSGTSFNSATYGIKFAVDDTIRIDGLDPLTKLTFATDGNLSVYCSFIRYS